MTDQVEMARPRHRMIRRHNPVTRIWHWANAGIMGVLLLSGLCIFNAHPRLYWGSYGANPDPAWFEIGAAEEIGYLRIGATELDTTGVLGVSDAPTGDRLARAFPMWATLPASGDLALARRWHLTFAWLLVPPLVIYALWSLVGGHLWRDLVPARSDCTPRRLWRTCCDHAMLRFGDPAVSGYNSLQRISYLAVVIVLIPGMVLSGLAMSPQAVSVAPWLLDLFGGRQSARSVHFIFAVALVVFVLVHLVMVLLAGPWNQIRAMITGRYRCRAEDEP